MGSMKVISPIGRRIYKAAQNVNFFSNRYLKQGGIANWALNKFTGFKHKAERLEWLTKQPIDFKEFTEKRLKAEQTFMERASERNPIAPGSEMSAPSWAVFGSPVMGTMVSVISQYFGFFGGQMTAEVLNNLNVHSRAVLLEALRYACRNTIDECNNAIYDKDDVLGFRSLRAATKREYKKVIRELMGINAPQNTNTTSALNEALQLDGSTVS